MIDEMNHLNAELTRMCDLRCSYCFNESGKKMDNELSLNEWKNVIDVAYGKGAKSSLFTGGEIMVRKDSPEVIQYSLGKGLKTSILSNGYNLSKRDGGFIKNLERVQISLDSANPKTHDSKRGEGSWKVARDAIDYSLSQETPVEISTTVSYDGLNELEGVAEIAHSTGSKILVRPMQPIGRALNKNKFNFDSFLNNVKKYLTNKFGDIFVEDFANYVPVLGKDYDKEQIPNGFITVLPDGMVRGTNFSFLEKKVA